MIDIIIPAYNAHKTIRRTLFSIAYQSNVKDVKVYIVNDASDKDYSKEIEEFSKLINIRELTLKTNLGPGGARQFGIDNSKSKYILFLDADDVFSSPNSISILLNAIENTKSDVVISNFYEEIQSKEFVEHTKDRIWLHGKIYRRNFLIKNNIQFNNTRANEDNGFNQLVFLHDSKVAEINQFTYIWMYEENSITRKNDQEYDFNGLEGYIYNIQWALTNAIRKNCNSYKIATLTYSTIMAIYFYYLNFFEFPESSKLIAYSKEIYNIYENYNILADFEKKDIFNFQLNYFKDEIEPEKLNNPIISPELFIDLLENYSKNNILTEPTKNSKNYLNNNEIINTPDGMIIAMACSKDWYKYLVIDIFALLNNSENVKKIYLFVETVNIEDIPYLNNLIQDYNIEIVLIDSNQLIAEKIHNDSTNNDTFFTKFSFIKLMLSSTVEEDKVLYIDTDAIVKKDISSIWNYNLDNYYLAAVKDYGIYKRGSDQILNVIDTYINSGFILFNLKELRNDNIEQKLLDLINTTEFVFPDQDALNLVCHKKIMFLPSTYNLCEDVTQDVMNKNLVKVFHYAGIKEPWLVNRLYAEEWYEEEEKFYKKYGWPKQ